jgi:3-oxoacyl-[acyl-carrier protein] reductase
MRTTVPSARKRCQLVGEFSQRTLLLTGAAGGIGAEIAKEFYAFGANLVLSDRSQADLDKLAEVSGFLPERTLLLAADVTSEDDNAMLAAAAVERFGEIDFLVPCAGVFRPAPLSELSLSAWRETLSTNLDGTFLLAKAASSHLAEAAAIVTLSSIAAHRGLAEYPHYAASKGAIVALTKSLALSLAPGVRVNAVAPGLIATQMTADLQHSDGGRTTVEQTPLGRAGHPGEIATVVKFLCSNAASFITGQVLHVNGGAEMVG